MLRFDRHINRYINNKQVETNMLPTFSFKFGEEGRGGGRHKYLSDVIDYHKLMVYVGRENTNVHNSSV